MIDIDKNDFISSTYPRAVGCTDASDARCEVFQKILTRNAEQLVSLITERSCSGVPDISSSTRQLVRSLIIPVVARRSLKSCWFSDRELGKCIASFQMTAARIHEVVDSVSREQAYIKYWTGVYMCKIYQDDNLPVREDWIEKPLFSGWLRRFMLRRLAKRDVSFFYSLDKGSKQSWPAMSEEKKELVLLKHAERISRQDEPVTDSYARTLRRCVREIFSHPPPPTKFAPSGGACLQARVKDGGALSLFEPMTLPDPASPLGKLRALDQHLTSYRKRNYSLAKEIALQRLNLVEEDQGEVGEFVNIFHRFYPAALAVDIVPLAEPAKFRIISKGDGYLYTALQPLQGQMLSCWKRSFYSTMKDTDLQMRVQELDNTDLPLWCSGDYEAATDLIRKHASMIALSELSNWPNWYPDADLGAASFGYCRARYPDGSQIDSFESQLMGHVLSFPLLCVENLAAYREAINMWVDSGIGDPKLGRLMWRNVIVNGDDILFKCTESFLPFFYEETKKIGLKASVGKNFVSTDMCTINSQVFRRIDGKMKRFSYLNQRFIFGKGNFRKASSDTDVTTPTQLSKGVNEMTSLVPWTQCIVPMTVRRFGKQSFGKFLGTANWYLPVHLGGYGFDIRSSSGRVHVTRGQRILAAMFVHNPSLALYTFRNGVDIEVAKYYGAIAKPRWVIGDYVCNDFEEYSEEDPWLARLAYIARLRANRKPKPMKLVLAKFRRDFRLKPSKLRTLLKYWSIRLVNYKLPTCPELNILR